MAFAGRPSAGVFVFTCLGVDLEGEGVLSFLRPPRILVKKPRFFLSGVAESVLFLEVLLLYALPLPGDLEGDVRVDVGAIDAGVLDVRVFGVGVFGVEVVGAGMSAG